MTVTTNRLTTAGEFRVTSTGEVRVFSISAARYWRILIRSNNGDAAFVVVGELEFLDSGGVDLATGGTPFASTFLAGQPASEAFDGVLDDYWESDTPPVYPEHLGYDFGSNVLPVQVRITAARDDQRMPKAFDIQYSYDNVAWNTAHAFTGETGWNASGNEQRTYDIQPSSYAARISKANIELASVVKKPKARISKALFTAPLVAQDPRVRISKANLELARGWPLVRPLPTTQAQEASGTAAISADTVTVMPWPATVKGKARSVTVVPNETNATVQFQAMFYGSGTNGQPAGLIKKGTVVAGCTDGVPVDLQLPGGVDVDFGNYFVGIWADQSLDLSNTVTANCYKQTQTFGTDQGLTFSGSPDDDGVPRLLVNVLQPDQERRFGAVLPINGGNSSDSFAANTMILARYYNLHEVDYEAAVFGVESDEPNSKFKVVVYSDNAGSPGDLLLESNIVTAGFDSQYTVVTFQNPITLSKGFYFLGVASDSAVTFAGINENPAYTNHSKFTITDLNTIPDPAPSETGITHPPIIEMLFQVEPPVLPGLKSPVLAVWSGVGDVGDNFLSDFSRVAEDGTIRVIESGASRLAEAQDFDFFPYGTLP